jgi:hypothetical protein
VDSHGSTVGSSDTTGTGSADSADGPGAGVPHVAASRATHGPSSGTGSGGSSPQP